MATTPAKDWRKAREEGVELRFISGVARVRPVELDFFLRVGRVPDILADLVVKIINNEEGRPRFRELPALDQIQKHKEFIEFLNQLTMYAFVEPVVKGAGEPLGDNEISVDDVPYEDKLILYNHFTRPIRFLEAFRQAQNKSLESVGTPENVPATSEPDHADQFVGEASNGVARYMDGVPV